MQTNENTIHRSKITTRCLARAGIIAALYVVLTYLAGLMNLAYGPVQFRFSEALTVLPFLFPEAIPGLFVGCIVSNLISPYGVLDLVVGSAATLLAAVWTAKCGKRWFAPMPPVIMNVPPSTFTPPPLLLVVLLLIVPPFMAKLPLALT